MKKVFKNNLEVCFTDTDSLLYKIYKPNIDAELKKIGIFMDFSNYEKDHPLYSNDNKKVPGKYVFFTIIYSNIINVIFKSPL